MTDLQDGTIVDERYKILHRLGAGGMGAVYKAEQIALNRIVAVKLLKEDRLTNVESLRRFQREARILQSLKHRNISAFYAYGVWDKQLPYIAMEYLEGETLHAYFCKNGLLTWKHTLDIAEQVCQALEYAHLKGVIHRDITPGNIFLVKDNDEETVKVTDFGLARILNWDNLSVQKLTATGMIVGTPQYMSPEQCVGTGIDARSDLYSLACVMYHMLFGQSPFDADTALGVVYRQAHDPVPAMEMGPGVPPQVARLIARALSKNREERFATAEEMGNQIQAILASSQTAADSVVALSAQPPLSKEARAGASGQSRSTKTSIVTALLALALIALCSLLLLLRWQARQKPAETPAAKPPVVAELPLATNELGRCMNYAQFLVTAKDWPNARRYLIRAEQLARANTVDIKVADALRDIAFAYRDSGHRSQSAELFKECARLYAGNQSRNKLRAMTLEEMSEDYLDQKQYAKARIGFVQLFDSCAPDDLPAKVDALCGISLCEYMLNHPQEAVNYCNRARALCRTFTADNSMLTRVDLCLARAQVANGDKKAAWAALQETKAFPRPRDRNSSYAHFWQGAQELLAELSKGNLHAP